MKSYVLATFLVLNLFVPTAFASDDGQTQPRLNQADLVLPNTSVNIIGTTNGSGNVKGVYCRSANLSSATINIYVNGGSAQALQITPIFYPEDVNGEKITGWIPLNVRFTSSIRVELQKAFNSGTGMVTCVVSWGLD